MLFLLALETLGGILPARSKSQTTYTNRVVKDSEGNDIELRAGVDYFTCVFSDYQDRIDILVRMVTGIDFKEFDRVSSAFLFNDKHYQYNGIHVAWGGTVNSPDYGLCISAGGKAMRLIASQFKDSETWADVFFYVARSGGHCTRLDGYVDQLGNSYFTPNMVYTCLLEGRYASRSRKWDYRISRGKSGIGETAYLGSRESNSRVMRVYNKAVEQGVEGVWVRTEMEWRGENADAVMRWLSEGRSVSDVVKAQLRDLVSFKDDIPDSHNRVRGTECRWWSDFLDNIEGLHVEILREDKDLERTSIAIAKQFGSFLKGMSEHQGGEAVHDFIEVILSLDERDSSKWVQKFARRTDEVMDTICRTLTFPGVLFH